MKADDATPMTPTSKFPAVGATANVAVTEVAAVLVVALALFWT